MKWAEMSEKERVRLILQRVMGCFILEETAKGYNTPDFPRGVNVPAGFDWPYAFWNTDGECWMIKDIATDPRIFDPLHDMNDAWLLFEQRRLVIRPDLFHGWWVGTFARISLDNANIGYENPVRHDNPAESICLAALRDVGVEIGV